MSKPFPALCSECKHSKFESERGGNLRCHNPEVNSKDPYALGGSRAEGTNCTNERALKWPAKCGMRGELWEPKIPEVKYVEEPFSDPQVYLEVGSPVMDSDGDIYFIRQIRVIDGILSVDCGQLTYIGEHYPAGWAAVADLKAPTPEAWKKLSGLR